MNSQRQIVDVFGKPISVINVGLTGMAEALRKQHIPVIEVDWHLRLGDAPHLMTTRERVSIDEANDEACHRIQTGMPMLIGMDIAANVIPGMHDHMLLHAGPPITWDRMCGTQRGAVLGALIYEGWAASEEEAAQVACNGQIEFSPCHHHHAVGPMAGIISPRMPVFIVENKTFGNRAYATLNEGLGKVLRYGALGTEVYERLRWMELIVYPLIERALRHIEGGIDLKSLIAQALHMGDECHNRNRAATSLLLRIISPVLVQTAADNPHLYAVMKFIDGNDHFFLNLSMAAAKSMLEPAEGIEGSSVVTVMARNGTDFGIQVAGFKHRWFTAPADQVQGLYFPGFTEADANPDIGDSSITETAGYGGFAMAAAPAITKFVGGSAQMAMRSTLEMYEITHAEHTALTIPALDFRGTPLGIDVRRVIETGILPQINTGIAHKDPGIGMIGAGMIRAPQACFDQAFNDLRQLC